MNKNALMLKAMFPMEGAAGALFDVVADALKHGETVEIRAFGTFSVVQTKARQGRNPRTVEAVAIPAGRRVRFKPSKALLRG